MIKHLKTAMIPVLMLLGNGAYALGLGDVEVRSYLGQPIAARIQLISASAQELATVTAELAAASDYEFVGMQQNLSVPVRFVVNTDPDSPGIEVSSRLPVRDPVVQFVVEVSWSGGRMLKEYTLFLDPPTIASRAPAPAVFTRSAQEPEDYPDPAMLDVVETIKPQPRPVTEPDPLPAEQQDLAAASQLEQQQEQEQVSEPVEPAVTVPFDELAEQEIPVQPVSPIPTEPGEAPGDSGPGVTDQASAEAETDSAGITPQDSEAAAEAQPVAAMAEAEAPEVAQRSSPDAVPASRPQATVPSPVIQADDMLPREDVGAYGPVQRGDTLWSIASRHVRGSEFSINQAMLAIQRLNPDAFGGNNINSLKTGVVLRMPADSEIGRMTQRQAMLEAMRQERNYASIRAGIPVEDVPPVLADLAPETAVEASDPATPDLAAGESDESRLELVPPSEGLGQSAGGLGADSATGAISSEELSETLARTEEELANAQQENEYLAQRIRELESQLAETGGTVESSDMAELESSLREDRLSGDEQPEVLVRQPQKDPWYQGKLGWLIGGLLLLVAVVVWLLRRIGADSDAAVPDAESATVVKIRSEAEEILESLDNDETVGEGEDHDTGSGQPEPGEEIETSEKNEAKPVAGPAEDSEVIELDTSDPETRLDLARAYLSMNDPESARQMLEEVLETGNEAQVREAQSMMQELEN
ncbi:MAG: tetratricopeptide repeat protein [Xanthomonadales bacterium]|nr:tetratricopeptide repeat protein [Gammaproteobacteria bacterium]NNE04804.1 tetratricopeptide repeat protein [Xanthomonadales bacterium]NNL95412.1 tetratricopeptide repeat protein [Xanthomonadales bacterium]